jgi:hypothetical protein
MRPAGAIPLEGDGLATGVAGIAVVGEAAELDGRGSEPERSETLARIRNAWQGRNELSG